MRKGRLRRVWRASLAVAGRSGTLAGRVRRSVAAGRCRGKTGTLNGVNTLAGVVFDADGRLLSFAFMANHVSNAGVALAALDGLAGSLATCGCR